MSHGFSPLAPHAVDEALEAHLAQHLEALLAQRAAGHCMRVADLDSELACSLARRLRALATPAVVVVLTDAPRPQGAEEVTATKLVELRNPLPDGSLRPPLLVFVPNSVRTSAEDSFGIATFEAVSVSGAYAALRKEAMARLPPDLLRSAQVLASTVAHPAWPWADDRAWVRYLLTVFQNGPSEEAAGAALYELALVPDRELFSAPGSPDSRARLNLESVRLLTYGDGPDRTRVLALALTDSRFKADLAARLSLIGLDDPATWTRTIVTDRALWPFTFDKWPFEPSAQPTDTICVEVLGVDLPPLKDGDAEGREELIGQQVLTVGKGGLAKFGLDFRADPVPSRVQGLSHFRASIHAQDGTPVGISRRKAGWTSTRGQARIPFGNLAKAEWDEGWYFVRVLAYTSDGEPVALVDAEGAPVDWGGPFQPETGDARRPNDSDLFYVLPGEEADVEPAQRSVPRYPSLAHASIDLEAVAIASGRAPDDVELRDVSWSERKGGVTAVAELRFGRDGAATVSVPGLFRDLQRDAIAHAATPSRWHVDIHDGAAGEPMRTPLRVHADAPGWTRLTDARLEFLNALADVGAVEVASLQALAYLARELGQAFTAAVDAATTHAHSYAGRQQLTALLSLDTATLAVSERRGIRRHALLVGPTHPLRAVWLVTWARLAETWLRQAADGPPEQVVLVRRAALDRLVPTGFPLALPGANGDLLIATQDLHPFWSLYAPASEEDPGGLVGAVARATGLTGAESGGVDGSRLAGHVRQYLRQRPYVRTLVINAFNPGRATALASALVHLQRDPVYQDLRYDVRLFGPDPTAAAFGDAFADLVDTNGPRASEAADAFSTYGGDHRAPKLAVARVHTDRFHDDPARYAANLSFLFDAFPPAPVAAQDSAPRETAPVHGLLSTTRTHFVDTGDTVVWTRTAETGPAAPLAPGDDLAQTLGDCARAVAEASAALAGEGGDRPALVLSLSPLDRALINRVHNVSDWVVTLDRTLGVEFFDHDGRQGRPDFLIDHAPAADTASGRHVVVTARSSSEVLSVIKDALSEHGLPADGVAATAVFAALRALSPQLALKLVANPTQRSEALGLALATLFLERKGAAREQIVVPLDAHLDLYREAGQAAEARGEAAAFQRTDLALFDLRLHDRTVTCNLVEVKAYARIGDLGAYASLRDSVAEQLRQSEKVLRLHFDPATNRPDQALKAHDFRRLLRYYLDRAVRFGTLSAAAEEESNALLDSLEEGYRLEFSRSAVAFDFGAAGFDDATREHGVDYFRIGRDIAAALVQHAADVTAGTLDEGTLEPLPALSTAAFLAPHRAESAADGPQTARSERDSLTPSLHLPSPSQDECLATPDLPADADAHDAPDDEGVVELDVPSDQQLTATSLPGCSDDGKPAELLDAPARPPYDVLLGVQRTAEQYGLLGEAAGRKVALDLNHTHTISLFGVQGGGKSYTLGSIVEMAVQPIPNLNYLPNPLAVVLFHYSPTQDYRPEFTSMVEPNSVEPELALLRDRYGVEPRALPDVHLLVPPGKVDERRREYPNLTVHPLQFASSELQASHWSFLMGIAGNASAYVKQLRLLMRDLRHDLSLNALQSAVDASALPDTLKQLARLRLSFAAPFVSDDGPGIRSLVRPGRLLIVDLRDEFIEQDEALGLFSVLLQLASDADASEASSFNKLVVFDEAHKYTKNAELVEGLVATVREMRHKGTSILIASQDPPSVPTALIELSSQVILHKFNSPAWLKHLQKANAALGRLTPEMMTALGPGEAYVWSSKATDKHITQTAVKVTCRPRVTHHGGSTRTAV